MLLFKKTYEDFKLIVHKEADVWKDIAKMDEYVANYDGTPEYVNRLYATLEILRERYYEEIPF